MTDKVKSATPSTSQTVFDLACRILNRELEPPLFREGAYEPERLLPRAPDFLPNAASVNREVTKANRAIALRNLSSSPAGHHYHLAALERLRAFVASIIRDVALGEAVDKGTANRILPAVLQQHETADQVDTSALWKELWERMEPISNLLLRHDRSVCIQVARAFSDTPKTVEDCRFLLLLAFYFHWERRCKERIVPCAACPRFFVAGTATAMTCSDACRQRYYRETQDEVGRLRLREQTRNHKRAQRERARAAADTKPRKAPAHKGKAGNASRPVRK